MKILSVSCGLAPDSHSGGERFDVELSRALVQAGDEVLHILAGHGAVAEGVGQILERVWPRRGFRWWLSPFVVTPAIRRVWREHGPFDVLRCPSPSWFGPACVLALRGLHPRPVLAVHVHHLEPTRLERALTRWTVKRAGVVIADSQFAAGQVRGLAPGARVRMGYCGVATLPVVPHEQYRLIQPWQMVAVGPLIPRKDPAFALAMADALVPMVSRWGRLRWIGEGPLRAALASRHHDAFSGPLFETEKDDVLRGASVFIHTATLEGFPLAVLEAMAWGLPVVARPRASLPELIEPEFLSDTPEGFARIVARLLDDPALRQKVGEANRRRVEAQFTWPKVADRVRAAFAEAISGVR